MSTDHGQPAAGADPLRLILPARRQFLRDAGLGFGSLALAALLGEESRAATGSGLPAAEAALPHHLPKAKRVIWLFMTGAPSQVDTWDYKPELQARNGQPLPGADSQVGFFQTSGKCLASPFAWSQHGASGSWVSDLFPQLSQHVDEMCFIHSMHLRANNHAPAAMELMSGFSRPGMPSMGAWLDYGLGSVNRDLPSFVVMHERKPRGDDQIWSAGFLPKSHQALAIDAPTPSGHRQSRPPPGAVAPDAAGGAGPAGVAQYGPCRAPARAGRPSRPDLKL